VNSYILSREVERALEELWDYIAFDSMESADRVLNSLFDAIELLAQNPRIGHKRKDLTSHPILFWPQDDYLIVYRPKKTRIEVVAIVHGSRDIPQLLRNLRATFNPPDS
jgi:antitoxin ParD1/3/4/toxin ParE1/3/4